MRENNVLLETANLLRCARILYDGAVPHGLFDQLHGLQYHLGSLPRRQTELRVRRNRRRGRHGVGTRRRQHRLSLRRDLLHAQRRFDALSYVVGGVEPRVVVAGLRREVRRVPHHEVLGALGDEVENYVGRAPRGFLLLRALRGGGRQQLDPRGGLHVTRRDVGERRRRETVLRVEVVVDVGVVAHGAVLLEPDGRVFVLFVAAGRGGARGLAGGDGRGGRGGGVI